MSTFVRREGQMRHSGWRTQQQGFSLMVGIFLILVLSLLSLGLVTVYGVQQQQSSLDVQGARAYQAARAGVEWGLHRHLRGALACSGATTSFMLPAGSSLSAFAVSVTCVQTPSGVVTATTRRQLTAVACNQPGAGNLCPNPGRSNDYVQRKVQVEF
ncbi:agglutinin biogenesis protein MshP [Massilia sp. W12]|uniref:agglutinin biogenesis protein MshP n=1 Tax=Massilia sp. W12 TaxID=3126507 RepID=UPI0030CE4DA1